MTDNIATLDGFTREVIAGGGMYTLELLVRPGADLDGRFRAWDMNEQEFITVNGWLFAIEDSGTLAEVGRKLQEA